MDNYKTIFYSKKCDGKRGGHTVEELKVICRSLGLKVSGTKEFLCNQLAEYFENNKQITLSQTASQASSQAAPSRRQSISANSKIVSNRKFNFDNLPVEIILNIIESLSYDDLLEISRTSKRFADISKKYKLLEKAKEKELRPEVKKIANIYGWKNVRREYGKELNKHEIDMAMEDDGWDFLKFHLRKKELEYIMKSYNIEYDLDFLLYLTETEWPDSNFRKEIFSWALDNNREKINNFWNHIQLMEIRKKFYTWFKKNFM